MCPQLLSRTLRGLFPAGLRSRPMPPKPQHRFFFKILTLARRAPSLIYCASHYRLGHVRTIASVASAGVIATKHIRIAGQLRTFTTVRVDYYAVLGVEKTARQEAIKKKYFELARECHPDRRPGDENASRRFYAIAEAYEVLGDASRRAQYDKFGTAASHPDEDPFDPAQVFRDFEQSFARESEGVSARPAGHGANVTVHLDLGFEEAIVGAVKEVDYEMDAVCAVCDGTGGRDGSKAVACPRCGGEGEETVRYLFMTMRNDCSKCGGGGIIVPDPCTACYGRGKKRIKRTHAVTIEPGTTDSAEILVAGEGAPGRKGLPPGDLYVHLHIRPSDTFAREGNDLRCRLQVPMTTACLGGKSAVRMLDGALRDLEVPSGSQHGELLATWRGAGVPSISSPGGERTAPGDMRVHMHLVIPRNLTKRQRSLLSEFGAQAAKQL